MLGRNNMRRHNISNLCSDSDPDSESGYASYSSAYGNPVTGYDSNTNVGAYSNRYPYFCTHSCSDSNSYGCSNGNSDIDPYDCSDSNSDVNTNGCSDIDPYGNTNGCSDIDSDSRSYSGAVRIISYGAGGIRTCKQ